MWAYYVTERSKGRTPSGAELDRVAGTHNYGRRVLRRWRETGRFPAAISSQRDHVDRPAGQEPAYAASDKVSDGGVA
jgi:hypothetical protein